MPDGRPPADPDHPAGRSLRRSMFYAVTGMGIYNACQFGVVILLAKFAGDEVLGQVQFSLALATPIVLFCSLELRGALVADAGGEFSFGTYRALRSLAMLPAAAVLLVICAWGYASDRRGSYAVIFAGMCAGKIVLTLAEVGWGLFQKRERLDLLAVSAVLRGLTMLGAFAVFVPLYGLLAHRGVIGPQRLADGAALGAVLYVLSSLALLVGFDQPRIAARADHDPTWTWSGLARLARQTFPLGVVLLLLHLCNSVPQLAIEQQPEGRAALGRFAALSNVTLAANLLIFQAANAAGHRLATYYRADLGRFLRLAAKLLGLAAATGLVSLLVALLAGQWLLRILYRAEYADDYGEFLIIVAASILALLTNVFGVLVTSMRLFWIQVPAQALILLTTLVATVWLIPHAPNLVRAGAWTVLVRSGIHAGLYGGCVLAGILLRSRRLGRIGPARLGAQLTTPSIADQPALGPDLDP